MRPKSHRNLDSVCAGQRIAPAGSAVEHPPWCDRQRCTATPDAAMGEAHRSAPVTIVPDTISRVRIAISLSQAHAPWQTTTTYVRLEVAGLDHDFTPVAGSGVLTAAQAAEWSRALSEHGQTAERWDAAQTAASLRALREGVHQ